MSNLIVGITGATGALAAKILVKKSSWPVSLVASEWGTKVYEQECGSLEELKKQVDTVYAVDDLAAAISSGSVQTKGMVIIPCSSNTLGEIASGISNNLITRAAHCHLKERRKLVLCLRETPLSLIDIENCATISRAGGIIMPLSPPFYMTQKSGPAKVSIESLVEAYCDRVLSILGDSDHCTWEDIK